MHIGQILELDEGISPVTCAGKTGYVGKQSEGEGKKGTWTRQFVVIKEGDDDIGVTLWNARYVKEGERIVVVGKTESYEGKITLSGKLKDEEAKSSSSGQKETSEKSDVDWDAKELREHRGYGIRDATQLVTTLAEINKDSKGMSPTLVKQIAEAYVQYVYNGPQFEDENEPVDETQQGRSEPPVEDDDIPF